MSSTYVLNLYFTRTNIVCKIIGSSQSLLLLRRCIFFALRIGITYEILGFVGFPLPFEPGKKT